MQLEASRRLRAADMLPARYRELLPTGGLKRKAALLQEAIRANQALLDAIADEQEEVGFGVQYRKGPPADAAGPRLRPVRDAAVTDSAPLPDSPAGASDFGGAELSHVHGAGCDSHAHGHSHGSVVPAPLPAYVPRRSAANFSKAKSTLHQLVRDWSSEGAAERDACYGAVMRELAAVLPVTPANANRLRVLVPGCGRECPAGGYRRAGSAATPLPSPRPRSRAPRLRPRPRGLRRAGQRVLVPNALRVAPRPQRDGGGGAARCPPVDPRPEQPPAAGGHAAGRACPRRRTERPPGPQPRGGHVDGARGAPECLACLSLARTPPPPPAQTAGEFAECYGTPDQRGAWDAVVSVFFVDTAPVIFEYFDVVWHALRPGGFWVNLGPLLYHWQGGSADAGDADDDDLRYGQSLELSYQEVRFALLARGFELVRESAGAKTTYAANRRSLLNNTYTPLMWVVRKPAGPGGALSVPAAAGPGRDAKRGGHGGASGGKR